MGSVSRCVVLSDIQQLLTLALSCADFTMPALKENSANSIKKVCLCRMYMKMWHDKAKTSNDARLKHKLCHNLCLPSPLAGSSEGLPGGTGEAPEEVLRQRPAPELSHPDVLGHGSQRSQLWDPGAEDAPGLGLGDRRGLVPGGSSEGPHAGEDQASHLL